MARLQLLIGLLIIAVTTGCNQEIVRTEHLNKLDHKCVHIKPIESENPYVGKVLRDVFQKEFIREQIQLCDPNSATVIITGSTFMTYRAKTGKGGLGGASYAATNQAIESVSIIAKNQNGDVVLTAAYDNSKQYTATKVGEVFGSSLAKKFK